MAGLAMELARSFASGATMWVVAADDPADGRHVAVEFVHPVIVGKRALPAVLVEDPGPVRRPGDVVLRLGVDIEAEVLQYHLLWELTHVALEHLDDESAPDDPTAFLYRGTADSGALRADLEASARTKAAHSLALQAATLERYDHELTGLADRLRDRGRILTFGNGGSATDAMAAAARFPAAISLADDPAVLTALANDVGFELVFARQLMAHGRPGDVAMGFSTSGGSPNVLRAFAEARARGLLTVGFAGYDGGAMAAGGDLDHCFVVASDSVHRIQEAQDALVAELARRVTGT